MLVIIEETLEWRLKRQECDVRHVPMSEGQIAYMKKEKERAAKILDELQKKNTRDQHEFLTRFDTLR